MDTTRKGRAICVAAICGLIAPVTSTVGWAVGGLVQPEGYSSADDDISQLGAVTASSAWLYNQIGANLTGLLIMALSGLWLALSPDVLGRIGAAALFLIGFGAFLDGFFRLDCQKGVDPNCVNDSWHADAHRMEGRFTVAFTLLAPTVLAIAFRRLSHWRDTWIPSLLAIPASLAAGVLFSFFGTGASTRASTLTWMLWAAFVAFQLWRKSARAGPELSSRAATG